MSTCYRNTRVLLLLGMTVLSMTSRVASFTSSFSLSNYKSFHKRWKGNCHVLKSSSDPLSDIVNKIPKLPFFEKKKEGQIEKQIKEKNDIDNTENILSSLKIESSIEPKTAYVDPERKFDIAAASMPFILRLGSGAFVEGYQVGFTEIDDSKYVPYNVRIGDKFQLYEKSKYTTEYNRQPRGPIVLYEFEGCPFCRKVREAVSILTLEVEFRPCPQGSRFRKEIKDKYGRKATFPFMKDPNTGIEMFESDAIIAYLFKAYGMSKEGNVPSSLSGGPFTTLMTGLSLLFRFGKGSSVKDSNPPPKPLVLWSAEGTPFGKLVREELNELQIAHVQIPCPRGSANRQLMFEKTGTFQIPYLEDPNNGVKLFESSAIIEYLQKMYGIQSAAVEYL